MNNGSGGARRSDQRSINFSSLLHFKNANGALKKYESLARFTLVGPQEQPSDGFCRFSAHDLECFINFLIFLGQNLRLFT